jgi:hypothetical protein
MKIAKVLPLFAIAIAMIAVLAISGCVEDAGNIAEDISEIGSKDYSVTLIKGVKRDIGVDNEYALLIKCVRGKRYPVDQMTKEAEVVIEIFSNNISIAQITLLAGAEESIDRLKLELVRVDRSEEYASIKISEKVDVVGRAEETAGAVGKIAESIVKSQT